MAGILYIVATHLGNFEDLTFRAKRLIQECDFIVCEEAKPAKLLLKNLNIFKEIIQLNEHTEKVNSPIVIEKLIQGKNCCLISDAGTPIFSDPGKYLIELAREKNIHISIVPGPDSLITALIVSGFDISKFYYAGWLSPKSEDRKKELNKLKAIKETIAIMETPYRLKQLISDVIEIFGEEIKISLACDLTSPNEKIIRGKAAEIYQKILEENLKCEFVLVLDNKKEKGS